MRKLECLRCDSKMQFLMREKFQKGDSGAWVGDLNFSFRGGFEMEIYSCPRCGKLEFFLPGTEVETEMPEHDDEIVCVGMNGIPQVRCRACGRTHDFDYPQCPYCDYQA